MNNPSNMNLELLSHTFDKTSTCYKYYWWLSILGLVGNLHRHYFSFYEGVIGMIVASWDKAIKEDVALPQMDKLFDSVREIKDVLDLPAEIEPEVLREALLKELHNDDLRKILSGFTKMVPYRFLSPWIKYTTDEEVAVRSQLFTKDCPYSLQKETVRMNPSWYDYIVANYPMLKDEALQLTLQYLSSHSKPLTEVQKIQLNFWTQFNDFAQRYPTFSSQFSLRNPGPRKYYDLAIGSSGMWLSMNAVVQRGIIDTGIYINNDKSLFSRFSEHKDEIESAVGSSLIWRNTTEKQSCRIIKEKEFDLRQSDNWQDAFEWLCRYTLQFKAIIEQYNI